jgi:hypothetical protein
LWRNPFWYCPTQGLYHIWNGVQVISPPSPISIKFWRV